MGVKFNPFTSKLDVVDSPDGDFDSIDVSGDITLDDGGTYTTTVQVVTPTANRTISFPDATGTVALVAGSSGQLTYNSAGAQAGATGSVVDSSGNVTIGGLTTLAGSPSANNTSGVLINGTWRTGASSNNPQLLINPSGTTLSTTWSTSGTGIGVNAASGFSGNLLDLQVNGTTTLNVNNTGIVDTTDSGAYQFRADRGLYWTGSLEIRTNYNCVLINTTSVDRYFAIGVDANTPSVLIYPEALNVWAQRNSTNAQTFRVYNTFTDASNYERGFLRWSSNVFEVGPEAAGTGTTRPMRITAATLKLPNLPTYADNAAAIAGSLVAGDVYKTATGELRITV